MNKQNRIEHILKQRKLKGFTWNALAQELPISGNSLRIAFKRRNVSEVYIEILEIKLGLQANTTIKAPFNNKQKPLTVNELNLVRDAVLLHEAQLLNDKAISNWLKFKLLEQENKIRKEYNNSL